MRIGKMDDSHNTDGLAELIEAGSSNNMTKSQKRKNWWHYYKWYVIIGVVLFAALVHIVGSSLGLFTKTPDLQIAYAGVNPLPEDTAAAVEQVFASLIEDLNQDGEVIVQVNQYTGDPNTTDAETAYYQYASEITLIGDISACESYLFLMDDPQDFQRTFQILAEPDGSRPDDADYSAEGKVFLWADCPLLASVDLGTYSVTAAGQQITGSNQELLAGLSLGRRCFYKDKTTDNKDGCDALWEILYNSWKNRTL